MEARVEGMEQEINQLKTTNQQLSDKLRVKEKICDNHNDTILQLKQVWLLLWLLLLWVTITGTGYKGSHDPRVTE